MSAPPAFIFVVRHGSRLDAADKRWHLTSPTPYDPPLTYGGFNQSRQVGNQISSILEQAKLEYDIANKDKKKRRRFKIVLHSSPFLRCVQTSIGISSGLAQTPGDSPHDPQDVFVPANIYQTKPNDFKSAVLRLDTFLGEWMSPEYFEMITPPPGAALMIGGAKADLLRREDYSALTSSTAQQQQQAHVHRTHSGSLWSGSPLQHNNPMISTPTTDNDGPSAKSAMAAALTGQLLGRGDQRKGYKVPKPNYAISGSGKIPEGLVAHARDECLVVDYQWDSMRAPLDFGDGGVLGEEWTSMHKRFRKGLTRMIHWYSTAESPAEMVTRPIQPSDSGSEGQSAVSDDYEEDVETVVILVSHGAGCNALIGAITHQPVLMDVGIASITMATRKQGVSHAELLSVAPPQSQEEGETKVMVDQLYDIRMSANTEHLHSTVSTPISTRSASTGNAWSNASIRGRAPSVGNSTGPIIGSFTYSDSFPHIGSRSTSASAAVETPVQREPEISRLPPRFTASPPIAAQSSATQRKNSSFGLWSPAPPSSLRLIDGAGDDDRDDSSFDDVLPNFGQNQFAASSVKKEKPMPPKPAEPAPRKASLDRREPFPVFANLQESTILEASEPPPFSLGTPMQKTEHRGPILSGPIRIKTDVEEHKPAEEVNIATLGDGLGGLWCLPFPPGEAERLRDLSHTKRRWTVTERAKV